mmetsp:Transcript_15834/g.48059  ORF Transcript_15834/g.48059 Transcript_15834/m.48059 type:complete len:270 (-) Transcript_15834:1013-1822(-)
MFPRSEPVTNAHCSSDELTRARVVPWIDDGGVIELDQVISRDVLHERRHPNRTPPRGILQTLCQEANPVPCLDGLRVRVARAGRRLRCILGVGVATFVGVGIRLRFIGWRPVVRGRRIHGRVRLADNPRALLARPPSILLAGGLVERRRAAGRRVMRQVACAGCRLRSVASRLGVRRRRSHRLVRRAGGLRGPFAFIARHDSVNMAGALAERGIAAWLRVRRQVVRAGRRLLGVRSRWSHGLAHRAGRARAPFLLIERSYSVLPAGTTG